MKKKKGKQRLPVFENNVYSNLIFQIASGNNYAQKIYEVYGKRKEASVIARQLKILEKQKYAVSTIQEDKSVFPMQRLRVYSINWNLIIKEFVAELKRHYKEITEEDKFLKSNWKAIIGTKINTLNLLEKKEFVERLKTNSYLLGFLKEYFSHLANLGKYNLSDAFAYLVFFGDLNILTTAKPNIEQICYFVETQNRGFFPKKFKDISQEELKNLDKKQHEALIEEIHKDTETRLNKAQNRRTDILNKDKELQTLIELSIIFSCLRYRLGLQSSINNSIEKLAFKVVDKYFSQEELKNFKEYYDRFLNPYFSDIKTETQRNSFKVTKTTENKHKKSGNTNQNKALSSESKQGESSK